MRVLFAALTVLIFGGFAASASAARIEAKDGELLFTAGDADKVGLTVTAGNSSILANRFSFTADSTRPTTGTPCTTVATLIFNCTLGANKKLHFATGAGADKIDAFATTAPFNASLPEVFETGGGDDVLHAGPKEDVVDAGAGDDTITGGPGPDVLDGGAGEDTFLGLEGDDVVRGSDGDDVLDLSTVGFGLRVSLDGQANDGPLGGQADVSVERVVGTAFADQLVGGEGVDRFEAGGGDDDVDLRGGGGDFVDCGPGGADRAVVDTGDVTVGCETVELPAPPIPVPDPVPPVVADPPATSEPAPPSPIGARLSFEFAVFSDGTSARTLRVRKVPAGARVQLRCTGGGCGAVSRRTASVSAAGKADLLRLLGRSRRLRPGAVLEVRITAAGRIGKVTRFAIRRRALPRKRSLCLPPGTSSPVACG